MSARGLKIFASNRLEILLDELAAQIARQPLGPLEREVVIVQSRGMYRWVTLGLARKLGIAATIATPFPGTFCRALAERIEGSRAAAPSERYEPQADLAYDREALAWRIFALLGSGDQSLLGAAATYLADDPDQQKRYQLAVRLAARFDEYQLYRGDMLLDWEGGGQPIEGNRYRDTAAWQAALWRAIVRDAGANHPARRLRELVERLRRARSPKEIPPRVSVFGASSLPPIFLEVLGALSRHSAVFIYFLNPTPEYWSDIRPQRAVAKQLELFRERGLAEQYAHVETGNPLLASLGTQGRELHQLLTDLDATGSAWSDLRYEIPQRTSILSTIQADIVELIEREGQATRAAGERPSERRHPPAPLPQDRSLQVHVCHSPMREMEVLRDLLLDAFAGDSSLRPHDVFVLAPDIATYAPYIEAVFGVEHEGEPMIPFTIADRSARHQEPAVEAALRILDLVGGRATATSVLGLLDFGAVRRAARILAGEAGTLHEWVRSTNVRWGVDAEHRAELGFVTDDADTWRAGLDRMLLAYAVGDVGTLVAGIVPASAAIAGESDLLGRFAAFLTELFARVRALASRRGLERWASDIRAALLSLLEPETESEQQELQALFGHLDTLGKAQLGCGVEETVDIEVVRMHLARRLEEEGGGAGFLTGAVTFCALKPMRAIPAKLVCVVGLGDGQFPHLDRRPSFDLMRAEHRAGDRSPRSDDRYLFLETLLAVRERLVLSYVGRSQKDNSELAPSIVLSELLDHVDRTFLSADTRAAHEHLVVVHALQPFSESYFLAATGGAATTGASPAATQARRGEHVSRCFSYSKENFRAAEAGARAALTSPAKAIFCPQQLRQVPEPNARLELSLRDLAEFWINPSKHFCRKVLGLRLPSERGELEDCERFELDSLEVYDLKERMVKRRLDGLGDGPDELEILRARGDLPHAGFAAAHYEDIRVTIGRFVDEVSAAGAEPLSAFASRTIELESEDWRLFGTLDRVSNRRALYYRPAAIRPKDKVRAWIGHLALNAAHDMGAREGDTEYPRETVLVGLGATIRFAPVADARARLETLIEGYREGLARPLRVFEGASYAFVEHKRKTEQNPQVTKTPLAVARAAFIGSEAGGSAKRKRGDADDVYVALCTRDCDVFADHAPEFESHAIALWEPAFDVMQEVQT